MLTQQTIYAAELKRWQARYEAHLDQVPLLLEVMRDLVVPLRSSRFDNSRISLGRGHVPLPLREDLVDDCDDLWGALAEYVGEVAERLQDPAPAAVGATWAIEGSIRGIPAWMNASVARSAGYTLIGWLIDRAELIRTLELTDSEAHLFALIRKLAHRYTVPPVERPSRRRVCTVCGEAAVVTAWTLGGDGEAVCKTCGAIYAPERDEERSPS